MPLECFSFYVLPISVFEIFYIYIYIFCEVTNKFDDVIAVIQNIYDFPMHGFI